jgi:hypothetical protein
MTPTTDTGSKPARLVRMAIGPVPVRYRQLRDFATDWVLASIPEGNDPAEDARRMRRAAAAHGYVVVEDSEETWAQNPAED